ncbi:hypothetical protein Lal_00018516 [Lupinus albus]|nr:hypothetical protein Lal_00018516 [Lupinus albus]
MKESKTTHFPDLPLITCDLLSILITTIVCESVFSIGVISFKNNVQALICTHNLLHDFVDNDNDDNDVNDLHSRPMVVH